MAAVRAPIRRSHEATVEGATPALAPIVAIFAPAARASTHAHITTLAQPR